MFMYPINIHREKILVHMEEIRTIHSHALLLTDLAFVGEDEFTVEEDEETEGYTITVLRSRLETETERAKRVAREELYMKNYEINKNKFRPESKTMPKKNGGEKKRDEIKNDPVY